MDDDKRLNIAMISEHASPLALTGSTDAGGQNVYVDSVARCLGEMGQGGCADAPRRPRSAGRG